MAHLTGFGLENFRVFEEDVFFDFAPITILTGTNSSGKSSLNKALLLLKNNFNKLSDVTSFANLNFEQSSLQLGDFYNVVNKKVKKQGISFRFHCRIWGFPSLLKLELEYNNFDIKNKKNAQINRLSITEDSEMLFEFILKKNYTIEININLERFFQVFDQNRNSNTESVQSNDFIKVNDSIYSSYDHLKPFVDFSLLNNKTDFFNFFSDVDEYIFEKEYHSIVEMGMEEKRFLDVLFSIFEKKLFLKKSTLNINFLGDEKTLESKDPRKFMFANKNLLNILILNKKEPFGLIEPVSKTFFEQFICSILSTPKKPLESNFKEECIVTLNDNNIGSFTQFIQDGLINMLKEVKSNIDSIESLESVRGIPQRFFSYEENKFQINNLINHYSNKKQYDEVAIENKFINKWLKEFNIGDELVIDNQLEGVGASIYIIKEREKINIADMGYGVTQILPIILKIIDINIESKIQINSLNIIKDDTKLPPKLLIIEEPETNLHPALQSKLADMFVDATKVFNIQFIIETHSEYLIRKLQYMTAKKEINPEMTQLYYFNRAKDVSKGQKIVKQINIQKDGSLTDDFGTGFFDEASTWKFELTRLKNEQNN